MHIYIYEMNILVDFVLNKNDRGIKKSNNTRNTSWNLLYSWKKKEEILHNKEQSSVQPSVQSTVQSSVQPKVQSSVQPKVQSNYVYETGILAVLAFKFGLIITVTTTGIFFALKAIHVIRRRRHPWTPWIS